MTEAELRQLYVEAYKLIQAERKARMFVFRDYPDKRDQKVHEMDRLLHILATLKDALKPHCEAEYEQPRLLSQGEPPPSKVDYR